MTAALPAGIRLTKLGQCPSCKTRQESAPVFKLPRTDVYACPACRLEYIDPSLDADSMMAIYTSSETLKQINPACENYYEYGTLKENSRTFKDYARAEKEIAKLARGRNLLEVGCGTGGFLEYAKTQGWHAAGLDSSPENAARLKEKGLEGICSDFMQYRTAALYDVVVLWDLIEHPQDPLAFVKKSYELLKPGGLLLLATPCYPNLLSVLSHLFYKIGLKGPAAKMYFLEHTTYFGPTTLPLLAERGGFKTAKLYRTETDLARYSFAFPVRLALYAAFFMAKFLGLQNRLMLIAQK